MSDNNTLLIITAIGTILTPITIALAYLLRKTTNSKCGNCCSCEFSKDEEDKPSVSSPKE